jgi:hypothetical protein
MRGIIRFSRPPLGLLVALAASVVLGAGVSASSATTPAGGSLKVWATPTNAGARGLVIAGAIGDYGRALSIDKNGKTDAKGNYSQILLQKGTFRINLSAFNKAAGKASFPIDKANCSSEGSITAPASVSNGTGLYKGISGNVHLTLTLVWIVSRNSDNKCDGTKTPLFHSEYFTGTGSVSFS